MFSLVHPNALEMLENLAVVVGRQGRHGEAVTLFERVLALKTLAAQPLPGWRPPAETLRQQPWSTRVITLTHVSRPLIILDAISS